MGQGGECKGPCNARWREADQAYKQALALYDPLDPAQSRPEPPRDGEPGGPIWCDRCKPRIAACLSELDDAAALRKATADGYRAGDLESARVSGSQDTASASPEHDDVDEMASVLLGHERAYRLERGWPSPPPREDLATLVTASTAWLRTHLDGILRSPGVAERFGLDVLAWHRQLCGKAKAGTRTLRKPLRCPSCGLLTLVWEDSKPDDVRCGNPACRTVMSYTHYEAEVQRRAGMGADGAAGAA